MNKLNLVDGIFILLVICASSKAGNISADEAYTTDNDGVAIVELTRRADNGDPDALYALGWKYEFGRGVSLNLN